MYYAERVRELEGTPALAYHSPHKSAGCAISCVGVGSGVGKSVACGIAAEVLVAGAELSCKINSAFIPNDSRKRKASAVIHSGAKEKKSRAIAKTTDGVSKSNMRAGCE